METPSNNNRFFIKELVNTKAWSTKGYPIPFEDIGDDMGLLVTNHPGLLEELEIAIARKRGGIREITESEVEEVKKKAYNQQLRRNSLSTNRIDQMRVGSTKPFNPNPTPQFDPAVDAEVVKPVQPSPSQPLDPVPTIDPALLRPKSSKRKLRDVEIPASAVPLVPVPVEPTPP